MKYLINFLIFASLLLYSCGNNSTTNNNNTGGETVLFSLDSLSIYSPSTSLDTIIFISNSSNVKISFDCLTNADSINGFSSFSVLASYIDTNNVYHEYLDTLNNNISFLNNSFQFFISTNNPYGLNFNIQCIRNNTNIYFIKLKNIKVLKL